MVVSRWFSLDASFWEMIYCLLIVQMPDKVFVFWFFILLLKCPCVKLSVFEFTQHAFLWYINFFFNTHTYMHMHILWHRNTFCVCNFGSPWRRDHLDTTHTHNLCVSAYFLNTLAFFPLTSHRDFQDHVSVIHHAQHITTKPTTKVSVYKNIPFFSAQSLHFFYLGGILSVVLKKNNHFTPKEGFPKTAYLMALKSCQLRGFSVCESKRSHRIMTQNAQLSPFDLFRFGLFLFFPFLKTHK